MRKKTVVIWASLLVLLAALTIPALHSVSAKPAPLTPSEHPEYRDAMNDLRSARKHLEKAEADGYGHRGEALRAIDRAIGQCEQAVQTLH